ncbi:MAG: hypothetical protein Q7K03_00285 [Dehalococcoidia bacterium]|nr:hypothetical protein [Dehalococcoidia bacterium]
MRVTSTHNFCHAIWIPGVLATVAMFTLACGNQATPTPTVTATATPRPTPAPTPLFLNIVKPADESVVGASPITIR